MNAWPSLRMRGAALRVWGKSKRLWQYVLHRERLKRARRSVWMIALSFCWPRMCWEIASRWARNIFAESMSEWITRTVQFFANRPEVQFVIRIHPGETIVPKAKSMATVVREALSEIPEHIHIIAATDKINTYDLIEIADLGLAYTTTVGMENGDERNPGYMLWADALSRPRLYN
jgi:hypothetical protein